jgi:hypothetical protein
MIIFNVGLNHTFLMSKAVLIFGFFLCVEHLIQQLRAILRQTAE